MKYRCSGKVAQHLTILAFWGKVVSISGESREFRKLYSLVASTYIVVVIFQEIRVFQESSLTKLSYLCTATYEGKNLTQEMEENYFLLGRLILGEKIRLSKEKKKTLKPYLLLFAL